MTCREQVQALCEKYGELSVLQEVQHYTRQHAVELDAEPLLNDAVACRELSDALEATFGPAARITN